MKWACVVNSKSNVSGEMAHVPLVPPKELSLPPPTRFVLREEGQKFISIRLQIKFSLTQPGLGPRAQSGIKIKKYHKKLKQSQIKTNLTPSLERLSPPSPLECAATPLVSEVGKGPLTAQAAKWCACAVHPWVLTTIDRGYRLQLAVKPPVFNGVVISVAQGEAAQVLEEEISSLMRKGVIRVIPTRESHIGFYSRYFVIPKRGGGLHPILDLRVLNKHLRKYKFKMLSLRTLCQSIRHGDWFISVDLQDTYFHIDIFPAHRKYLRFAYQGTAYEYTNIPFGLALAPRVFSKCVEAALTPLRNGGVRVSSYLDDLLICVPSPRQAESDTYTLETHLERLGFKINQIKSCLTPVQEIVYLGLRLNSVMFRAFLSEDCIKTFHSCLSLFQQGRSVSFRRCLRLLGLMASTVSVVPLGLLRMREFQIWTASQGIRPKSHLSRRVRVSPECMSALRHWRAPSFLRTGFPLGPVMLRKVVTTDASLMGWGAGVRGQNSERSLVSHTEREEHTFSRTTNSVTSSCIFSRIFYSVSDVLCFLQDLLVNSRTFSTVKVYLSVISACHVGFNAGNIGQHPLVCRFMRGARRLHPVSKPLVPP